MRRSLPGPAVTPLTDGGSDVRTLLGRAVLWRVPLPWYLVALGLPALVALLAVTCAAVLGPPVLRFRTLTVLDLVLVVLVVGGEQGWRGYALPATWPS